MAKESRKKVKTPNADTAETMFRLFKAMQLAGVAPGANLRVTSKNHPGFAAQGFTPGGWSEPDTGNVRVFLPPLSAWKGWPEDQRQIGMDTVIHETAHQEDFRGSSPYTVRPRDPRVMVPVNPADTGHGPRFLAIQAALNETFNRKRRANAAKTP